MKRLLCLLFLVLLLHFAVTATTPDYMDDTAYPYYSQGRPVSDSSSKLQSFSASRAGSDRYPNARQAVLETDGELLFYQGKVIVPCSYSVSNCGSTVSSKERWWQEHVYRSTIAANVYTPDQYAAGWELVR